MSSVSWEDREEKIKWLIKPLNWALAVSTYTAVLLVALWVNTKSLDIVTNIIIATALATLVVTDGLLYWALYRIAGAARGRY